MTETNASGSPIVNIVGDKVALGPLHRDLVPCLPAGATTSRPGVISARRSRRHSNNGPRYERDAISSGNKT
jgi:hypothetical protein